MHIREEEGGKEEADGAGEGDGCEHDVSEIGERATKGESARPSRCSEEL